MYDYGQDTIGMWGGEPSLRVSDPTVSLNNTNSNLGAKEKITPSGFQFTESTGKTAEHSQVIAQGVADGAADRYASANSTANSTANVDEANSTEWNGIAAQQEQIARAQALRLYEEEYQAKILAENQATEQAQLQRSQDARNVGEYKSKGSTFDSMRSAATAAGHAEKDATRRGSQINLVSNQNNQKTTSLLFRRPSSLERELDQAKAIHAENRRQHEAQSW